MFTDETMARVRGLNRVAEGRGQSLAQLALAWALRDERMTSLVVGASSVRQLEENIKALEQLVFDDDELSRIDEHAVDSGINLWASSSEA
jgi:L-glyceraldehyde 3-phosphate reductase